MAEEKMIQGMQKPKKLKAGDTVAAVTLSWGGPNVYHYRYEAGKK